MCFGTDEFSRLVGVCGVKWVVAGEETLATVEAAESLLPPHTLRQVWLLDTSNSNNNSKKHSSNRSLTRLL